MIINVSIGRELHDGNPTKHPLLSEYRPKNNTRAYSMYNSLSAFATENFPTHHFSYLFTASYLYNEVPLMLVLKLFKKFDKTSTKLDKKQVNIYKVGESVRSELNKD